MNKAKGELQLLTGVLTKDMDYLYYLLVKDGTKFKPKEEVVEEDVEGVPNLEDWFNSL